MKYLPATLGAYDAARLRQLAGRMVEVSFPASIRPVGQAGMRRLIGQQGWRGVKGAIVVPARMGLLST
jgi:hypothetical protein